MCELDRCLEGSFRIWFAAKVKPLSPMTSMEFLATTGHLPITRKRRQSDQSYAVVGVSAVLQQHGHCIL